MAPAPNTPPEHEDGATQQPPQGDFESAPDSPPSDHDDTTVDMLQPLEFATDGTPLGIPLDALAVAQPDNYQWKMMLWNEPRLAVPLLHQRRTPVGRLVRGVARCLALARMRGSAARLLRLARRHRRPDIDLQGAELEVVALLMPGKRGHELSPDVTIRVSWPRQLRGRRREMLINLEFGKTLSISRAVAQLTSYFIRFLDWTGARLCLRQEYVVTGPTDTKHRPRWLVLCKNYNGVTLRARVNYADECSAAHIPAAARKTEFGAMGVLEFADGQKPEDVANGVRRWYNNSQLVTSIEGRRFVSTFLQRHPELGETFPEEVRKLANGEVMADGGPLPKVLDTERIRSLISSCLELVDGQKVPFVRDQIEQGREEGLRKAHVDGLLAVLRGRNIWLSSEQKAKLRSMGCPELPAMQVALDAADADDFARRAGL